MQSATDYHTCMHGLHTATEEVTVFTPHSCAENHARRVGRRRPDGFFFRKVASEWMGLSNAGTPYIHLVAVDHSDNGALQWKLRVDTGGERGTSYRSGATDPME